MENTTKFAGPGELFSRSWKLYKAHFGLFVAIIAIPLVLDYCSALFNLTHVAILEILGILCTLVGLVLTVAMYPGLVDSIHRASTDPGATITVKGQYKIGFGFFWSFILVALIGCLSFMGSFALFLIPGIVVAGYAGMYMFTFVVDGKKGFSALTESYSLVKGRWWGVFVRILALVVPIWLVVLIIGSIFGLSGIGRHTGPVGVTSIIFTLIVDTMVVPFALAYTYDLYSSLKATRLPTVDTKAFKGWLIASLCVGVLFVVLMPFTVLFSLSHSRASFRLSQQAQQSSPMIPYTGTSTAQ